MTDQPGIIALNTQEWSMSELNVPFYSEPSIYKNVARYLCSYAANPSDVTLLIAHTRMLWPEKHVTYDCSTL
jgi:hypothetical protein